MSRESDIDQLCSQVLKIGAKYWESPYSVHSTCPLCEESLATPEYLDMGDLPHKPNCGYLIAKDLMTGKELVEED